MFYDIYMINVLVYHIIVVAAVRKV